MWNHEQYFSGDQPSDRYPANHAVRMSMMPIPWSKRDDEELNQMLGGREPTLANHVYTDKIYKYAWCLHDYIR